MREILFRAKRLDTGEWVEGFLVRTNRQNVLIATNVDEYGCGCCIPIGADNFEVAPATVGQFTGLVDKHGQRIFEGDFLNGYSYPFLSDNAHNYFAEVVWFENSPAFGLLTHKNPLSAVRGISAGNSNYMEDFDARDWEVIGNIHDNSDLLEGGQA